MFSNAQIVELMMSWKKWIVFAAVMGTQVISASEWDEHPRRPVGVRVEAPRGHRRAQEESRRVYPRRVDWPGEGFQRRPHVAVGSRAPLYIHDQCIKIWRRPYCCEGCIRCLPFTADVDECYLVVWKRSNRRHTFRP